MRDSQEHSPDGRLTADLTPAVKVVDPSDAVTGMSFVFGLLGATAGVLAALVTLTEFNLGLLINCLIAAIAFGSAGIVLGGMIGAVLSLKRGIKPPRAGNGSNEDRYQRS
ncbi:hypothetical protein [Peteryoungia algae]|uniref:Uncharacterized protein n=1 Tax=Peteryoungia algae TaxID=2919917 RepID=A0ABT0D5T6_9HYPH|nr:hypothetical protein [Rhizobium sp. SSM4.3]MCJ8240674.1 hypothetical protein [Rhizobium sp. SSM4.3]